MVFKQFKVQIYTCHHLIKIFNQWWKAGKGFSSQQLEALVKMVPTKDEEAKLCSYKGDINELGSAEKVLKLILRIPFAFLRVEAMLYREAFEDEVVHLRNSFSMLEVIIKSQPHHFSSKPMISIQ